MYVFARTNNPRPTFSEDMTDSERAAMVAHVAYWSGHAARGSVVAFGPVHDPRGVYGIAILRVADVMHAQRLVAEDPAREILTYELHEMPRLVLGQAAPQ